MAHVFAHDPKMVIISRWKDAGAWSIHVEELDDNKNEDKPLIAIYHVDYKDEEIDTAVDLFFSLIRSQRKDFEHYAYKELGKWIILSDIQVVQRENQNYLYETFRDSVKRSLKRRRRKAAASKAEAGD